MALGSTQLLTEMSTRSVSWGKGGRCVRLTTLPSSWAVVMISGNLNFLEPSWPLQACNGIVLPLPFTLAGEACSEIPSGDAELGPHSTSPGVRGGDGNMAMTRHTEVIVNKGVPETERHSSGADPPIAAHLAWSKESPSLYCLCKN